MHRRINTAETTAENDDPFFAPPAFYLNDH
jgi:hypothetical protein